jgi:hypothetical protein
MAIQVPKVDRIAPQETASVGRLDVRLPDMVKAAEPQAKAAGELLQTANDAFVTQLNYAAKTEATAASNELHSYLDNALEGPDGVKYKDGDPRPAYAKLEEDEEKRATALREKYKDATSETRAAVEKEIAIVRTKFNDKKISAQGVQLDKWRQSNKKAGVGIAQNEIMDGTANLDISDPNAWVGVDQSVKKIYDLHLDYALAQGSAKEVRDEKGNLVRYDIDPAVQQEIVKDRAEGLTVAIENLANSGDVAGAEAMAAKYSTYIDGVNKNKFKKTIEREGVEVKALQEVNMIEKKRWSKEKAVEYIDKIPDLRVKEKTLAKYNDSLRTKDAILGRAEKDTYKNVASIILDRQKAGKPFPSVNAMESDPSIKRILDKENIKDPKLYSALRNLVEQPNDSDQTVKSKMFARLQNGGMANLSYEDLTKEMSGLNKKDRAMFESQWKTINTDTQGEKFHKASYASAEVKEALFTLGYVDRNDFLKFDDTAQRKINEATDEFLEVLNRMPPSSGPVEISREIKRFAAAKKKNEVFKATTFEAKPVDTSGWTRKSETVPTGPAASGMAGKNRKEVQKALWIKSSADPSKRTWPSSDEIDAAMKNGK